MAWRRASGRENLNLALDVARKVKAGSVWINSTNLFDAASGFGGYRESGYGREGGREGLFEYMRPNWQERPRPITADATNGKWGDAVPSRPTPLAKQVEATAATDCPRSTARRSCSSAASRRALTAYSAPSSVRTGTLIGQVGDGNRKDIRNAVEAAHAAEAGAFQRPQPRANPVLHRREPGARADEFAARHRRDDRAQKDARAEVDAAIERLFTYAA